MSDLTTKILIEIRDEIRNTRDGLAGRIDETNSRLDETNVRLDRLERRQVATEVRVATELTAVTGAVHELRDLLIDDRKYSARIEDHEQRIAALEQRDPNPSG